MISRRRLRFHLPSPVLTIPRNAEMAALREKHAKELEEAERMREKADR